MLENIKKSLLVGLPSKFLITVNCTIKRKIFKSTIHILSLFVNYFLKFSTHLGSLLNNMRTLTRPFFRGEIFPARLTDLGFIINVLLSLIEIACMFLIKIMQKL